MARNSSIIEEMLSHLINEDTQRAEELFHEYVVKQSRTIYESLIEAELDNDMDQDDDEMDLDDNDPSDDLAGDLGDDLDDDFDSAGDKEPSELFTDLDKIVDELQAKFDALEAGKDDDSDDDMDLDSDDDMDDDMDSGNDKGMKSLGMKSGGLGSGGMANDKPLKDHYSYSTMREYVERVPGGHGAEKRGSAENSDKSAGSMKFSKNDMGGTSSNILSGRNGSEAGYAGAPGGKMKGSALSDTSPRDMNTGNLNKVGGYKGSAYSRNNAGHGAEKKGQGEKSTDGQSLFRGRR